MKSMSESCTENNRLQPHDNAANVAIIKIENLWKFLCNINWNYIDVLIHKTNHCCLYAQWQNVI